MDKDIISLPVQTDKKRLDSKFRMVTIAAQRAKELSLGAKPKVGSRYKKVSTQAILEAMEGSLEFLTGDEARVALGEAKKLDIRRLLDERKREAKMEELTELERDLKVYLHEREEKDREGFEEIFGEKGEEEHEEPPKE